MGSALLRYKLHVKHNSHSKFQQIFYQAMTTDEGASLNEQLIEAVRRNNLELLEEVLERLSNQYQNDPESSRNKTAELINNAKDPIGNHILHVAALNGSCKFENDSAFVIVD